MADEKITDLAAAPGSLADTDLVMLNASGGTAGRLYTRAWSAIKAYVLNALAGTSVANTPAGNISATNVQAALNELDTEKQTVNSNLTAIAGLTSAADKLPYFTGSGTAALSDLTAAGRALIDDASASAQRTTLGLVIGTDVFTQRTLTAPAAGITITNGNGVAGNPTFSLANDLAALEALSGTNTIYYRSAADTWSAVTIGSLLSFSAGTLNVGDVELTAIAGLTSAANKLPYFTGVGTAGLADFTTAGRALIDDADTTAQRATLGLGTAATRNTGTGGANVPLLSASFNFWSGLNSFYGLAIDPPGGQPQLKIRRDSGSADNRLWDLIDFGSGLQLRALNDAENAAATALSVTRSGTTITNVYVGSNFVPLADNSVALGSGTNRFNVVYAATGSINTSDAREKTQLRPLEPAEVRAIRRVMSGVGVFQWLDAVALRGENNARLHVGVTAQAVAEAFAAEGLDPARYALWCADPLFEIHEVEPGRYEEAKPAVIDPESGDILTPEQPARYVPPVTETRAVIDESTGAQMIRLGVRYDQLHTLALAVLFADNA